VVALPMTHAHASARARSAGLVRILTFLLLLAAAVQAAPAPSVRLREALADGDLPRAREALVDWIAQDPDRAALHYNLACLEARLDAPRDAVAALDRAFRLGFDDVRRAAADPDLAALAEDPGFRSLLDDTRLGLERAARRRATVLTEGRRLPLTLSTDGRPAMDLKAALEVSADGFRLELTAPAGALADGPEPWLRGGGVLLTLAAPRPEDVFDTDRVWTFGFGRRDGLPVGVALTHPDRLLDTQVLELAPDIAWDKAEGTRTLTALVPWSYVAPYALPGDSLFGVNVEFAGAPDGSSPAASLVADPSRPGDAPGPRRYLPLTLRPDPDGPARLSAVVASTVAGSRPLPVDLAVWTPHPARAVLALAVEDNDGASVVTSGGDAETLDLPAGLTVSRRWVDVSALPDGPYRLRAAVALDDSTGAEWRGGLFRFRGDWAYTVLDRCKGMPDAQRASVEWRLELVDASLSERDPRANPAPLMTTVAETEGMIHAYAGRGTILPESGARRLIWPSDLGPRRVQVVMPEGWSETSPPPLLVLEPAGAGALLEALGEAMASGWPAAALVLPEADQPWTSADRGDLRVWLEALLPRAAVRTAGGDGADLALAAPDLSGAESRRTAARRLLEGVAGR